MNWLLLTSISVFLFTTLNLLQRVLATESKNARALSILFNSTAALISFGIFIFTGGYKTFNLPTEPNAWFTSIVATIGFGIFERGRFTAAKLLDASVLSTITNLSVFVAFIGAAILYKEVMTVDKLIGGMLILISLILVSFNKNVKKQSSKGVIIATVISILLGIGWMMDKAGSTYFDTNTYAMFVWILPVFVILFPGIKVSALKEELRLGSWKVFLLALLNVLGYLAQLTAVQLTDATKVIPIVQLSTLFTVLMGVVILKEKENIVKKIFAGLLAVVGAILLV